MISQIAQIAKIESLLSSLKTTRFNALLPLTIDVKSKSGQDQYMLQIGSKEISTKSVMDLEVGSKYWGIMKEDPVKNSVTLSSLLKKPKLLQMQRTNFLPEFSATHIMELATKEQPKVELKGLLLERLSTAVSKNEFMTLTNMIAALNENVFTMVLKEGNQSTMFQFKKRKRSSHTQEDNVTIDFYAAFEHLGPVEGEVTLIGDERRLSLQLYYKNAMEFLEKEDVDVVINETKKDIDNSILSEILVDWRENYEYT
ncbi:MAG: hypothetical protein K0U47_09945, partial [Epsilonproteobacteria bacterium]|nr:hypothetical protein [Campylobacterota bacterium]